MGWDSFGLPAENAAIERNKSPQEWTEANIVTMRNQMVQMGFSFDWERELRTSDPNYYKWTQYIFLKLLESKLVYQQYACVNWDPIDQTVLADEQVDSRGRSWRSGAKVQKKYLKQWFIRTTHMAAALYKDLNNKNLKHWGEVSKIQKHWIGEPNGCSFAFKILGLSKGQDMNLSAWTQHPELLYGVNFLLISPQHWLAQPAASALFNRPGHLEAYHPLTGESIPIVVTNIPLQADCECGNPSVNEDHAVVADEHQLEIREIQNNGQLMNSGEFSGLPLAEARTKIPEHCHEQGLGGSWHRGGLRDWLVSRQRYWGTPIPVIHCEECGCVPVPYDELPVKLPKIENIPNKGNLSFLGGESSWVSTNCPRCGAPSKREQDTMDTFVDSSWYYLRYLDTQNKNSLCGLQAREDLPVDLYVGGKEHAELHLYYARFIGHFLYSQGITPDPEPFHKLLVQGMVKGKTYSVLHTGEYLQSSQVEMRGGKQFKVGTNDEVVEEWEKMSKSKHNGVDPQSVMDELGIDTFRLMILGHIAPQSDRHWSYDTLPGILNWQKKIWDIVGTFLEIRKNKAFAGNQSSGDVENCDRELFERRNYHLSKVNHCFLNTSQLSVALTHLMSLTTDIKKYTPEQIYWSPMYERTLGDLIIMISTYAPAFSWELWSGFQSCANRINDSAFQWDSPVMEQTWPEIDDDYHFDMICQINGDDVCKVKVPKKIFTSLDKPEALQLALASDTFQKALGGSFDSSSFINFKIVPFYVAKINFRILDKRKPKKKKKAREN